MRPARGFREKGLLVSIFGALCITVLLVITGMGGRMTGPIGENRNSAAVYQSVASDSADPAPAPPALSGASTGTYRADCGVNSTGIRNSDNLVVSPGVQGAAHHLHEYVGNESTNAFSTEATLNAAETSCLNGDLSSYYWPVLRVEEPGLAEQGHQHQFGTEDEGVVAPHSVLIEFRGNPTSNVVPLAHNVRTAAGNAHGYTQSGKGTEHVQWSCSGTPERETKLYPLCPAGEQTVRSYDFPSCWNGRSIDSADHRSHLIYPSTAGFCPVGTFPVPQLHLEVSYLVPRDARFTIDTFPEEQGSSISDHAHFINLMSAQLMSDTVSCLNEGRHCEA